VLGRFFFLTIADSELQIAAQCALVLLLKTAINHLHLQL